MTDRIPLWSRPACGWYDFRKDLGDILVRIWELQRLYPDGYFDEDDKEEE